VARQALYKYGANNAMTKIDYKFYEDQGHSPFFLKTYEKDETFLLNIRYGWHNSPAKDYTVKVYSKNKVKILNVAGKEQRYHTDGQSPTEFTRGDYCGMSMGCKKNTPFKAPAKPTIALDTATPKQKAAAIQLRRLMASNLGG